MTASFISENQDQELSLQELQAANGGILMLIAACLPGVANARTKAMTSTKSLLCGKSLNLFQLLASQTGRKEVLHKLLLPQTAKAVLTATCLCE